MEDNGSRAMSSISDPGLVQDGRNSVWNEHVLKAQTDVNFITTRCGARYIKNTAMKGIILVERDDGPRGATTFKGFSKLPLELQRMVWEEACFIPSNIDIWGVSTRSDNGYAEWQHSPYGAYCGELVKYRSHHSVPSILHASKDSRLIDLRHYSLSFAFDLEETFGFTKVHVHFPPRIYASFACDIICPLASFPSPRPSTLFQENLSMGGIEQQFPIRRITIPTTATWNAGSWHDMHMLEYPLDEVILYAGSPASLSAEDTFDPATASPFSMDFISLDQARARGLIGNLEYVKMLATFQAAKFKLGTWKGMFKGITRDPKISYMYLESSATTNW